MDYTKCSDLPESVFLFGFLRLIFFVEGHTVVGAIFGFVVDVGFCVRFCDFENRDDCNQDNNYCCEDESHFTLFQERISLSFFVLPDDRYLIEV